MLYKSYLGKLNKCPFCHLSKDEKLKENKYAILIFAKAPYTKDHLLVIPKKHSLNLKSLTKREKDCIEKLLYYGMKKLHKKHSNVNILYREGIKKEVGKSISHLHYHLIPNMTIGSKRVDGRKRKISSEEDYIKHTKKIKKELGI
ncbi:MAG: HIT domain-containing protein [archaeon]